MCFHLSCCEYNLPKYLPNVQKFGNKHCGAIQANKTSDFKGVDVDILMHYFCETAVFEL